MLILMIGASVASSAVTAALVGESAQGAVSAPSGPVKAPSSQPQTAAAPSIASLDKLIVALSKQVSALSTTDSAKLSALSAEITSVKTTDTGLQTMLKLSGLDGRSWGYDLFELLEKQFQCAAFSSCNALTPIPTEPSSAG